MTPTPIHRYFGNKDFRLELQKHQVLGHSGEQKIGVNPDIPAANEFVTVWDGKVIYEVPEDECVHDIASLSDEDTGTVLSSGTADDGSTAHLVDAQATFISDGVAVGDLLLNDSNVEVGFITEILSETGITFLLEIRNPDNGEIGNPVSNGDAYRVVTNAATGASIFWLQGLTGVRMPISEFVILNGTNDVETKMRYIRQPRARVFGPNTTGAIGNISSTAQIGGTITALIINGNNGTLAAFDTVPINQTWYLDEWWASVSKKQAATADLRLRVGVLGGISYVLHPRSVVSTGESGFIHPFKVPLIIAPGLDITVEVNSNAINSSVSSGLNFVKVDRESSVG